MAISIGKVRTGKKLTKWVGVTIHNTGNADKGSGAQNHFNYLQNNYNKSGVYGFHYAVDDTQWIECIPPDEKAEHTGTRAGNDTTVGIEICMNSDGNLLQATNNGAHLAALMLYQHGFKKAVWKENIFQHNDWSGKDCPQMIRAGKPYGWTEFVNKVNEYLSIEVNGAPTVEPEPEKPTGQFTISRILKVTSPLMQGEDVKWVQECFMRAGGAYLGMLGSKGADGKYGNGTSSAVRRYQNAMGLKADGVVGEHTAESLGAKWGG